METVVLVGAEMVSRAASQMTAAADRMQGAAMEIDAALYRHAQFLDEWLLRAQALLTAVAKET